MRIREEELSHEEEDQPERLPDGHPEVEDHREREERLRGSQEDFLLLARVEDQP